MKSTKHSEEYTKRQELIFEVFNAPNGREVLKILNNGVRKSPIPAPRTADEQVNFVVEHAFRQGQNEFLRQIKTQMEQAIARKSKGLEQTNIEEVE